ncbi:MAG TPA: GNAT family N-acetyltransferase [Thermoanaerobaculia bacterium]|nr:GNAT family N-acetyltransferase [Thermoanaerobaculia bacterium]
MSEPLTVRSARAEDRDVVLRQAARLASFETPAWRPGEEIVSGERRTLARFFSDPLEGERLLLAVGEAGAVRGFVFLETVEDYFTQARHGHVGMLVVSEGFEGQGVGSALMRAAEEWGRQHDFDRLSLNVFATNHRALELYHRLGYVPETLRFIKLL